MKVSEVYAGSFLKAADLQGRAVMATIDRVTLEKFDDEGSKLVAHFRGKNLGLVLNKTNSAIVAGAYGDDTDAWHGRPLEIFPDKTTFGGRLVDCIRVRIPQQPPQQTRQQASMQAQQPPQQPQSFSPMEPEQLGAADDDLPW